MARRGRPPHSEVLTPRQQEVLALVREGLSNREIAERLDISLDGAKFHVSEILTRIGVPSREEAARWSEAPERATARLHARLHRWRRMRRQTTVRVARASSPCGLGSHRAGQATPPLHRCSRHTHRKLAMT